MVKKQVTWACLCKKNDSNENTTKVFFTIHNQSTYRIYLCIWNCWILNNTTASKLYCCKKYNLIIPILRFPTQSARLECVSITMDNDGLLNWHVTKFRVSQISSDKSVYSSSLPPILHSHHHSPKALAIIIKTHW